MRERVRHAKMDEKTERRHHNGSKWQRQSYTTLSYRLKGVQNEKAILLTLKKLMRLMWPENLGHLPSTIGREN